MMMLAVMYGMIPSAKIEKLPNAPPENRFEEPERALLLHALLELLDRVLVDARHADGDTQPVQGDHPEGEQDLVPEVGDLEDVLQVRKHHGLLGGSGRARCVGEPGVCGSVGRRTAAVRTTAAERRSDRDVLPEAGMPLGQRLVNWLPFTGGRPDLNGSGHERDATAGGGDRRLRPTSTPRAR